MTRGTGAPCPPTYRLRNQEGYMWLVLCSANDISAQWAYHGLKRRGLDPLEMIYAEALPFSLSWEHRVTADGASINLTLPDGRSIEGGSIKGALNRLIAVPSLQVAHSPDGEYATQEFSALFLSWLYALPDLVINRATPQGLCGQWRQISEWVWLASRAGLPVPAFKQSSNDLINEAVIERRLFPMGTPTRTLIVINGTVCGADIPDVIRDGCARLSELSGTALLGVEFVQNTDDHWLFASATPMPDMRYGGEELLDRLASILLGEQEQSQVGQAACVSPDPLESRSS